MANEYLKRTPTSTGNRKVFTWSGWVKQQGAGAFFSINGASNYDVMSIASSLDSTGDLAFSHGVGGSNQFRVSTSNLFGDQSGWFHFLVSVDTTKSTSTDRCKLYVNGILQNNFNSSTFSSINYDLLANLSGKVNYIGRSETASGGAGAYLESEIKDVFMVDGQALTPDVFGFYKDGNGYISAGTTQSTDFRPGQWVPHSPRRIKSEINRRGGFGVNGFYLPMNSSNNFGADFHCEPDTILRLKSSLPQPKAEIDGVGDYTGALRDDPFKDYLVLAIPGVSGGLQNGFGDYSAAIRGSGSPLSVSTTNSPSISSDHSVYYGSSVKLVRASSQDVYVTGFNKAIGTGDFTIEGWYKFDSRSEDFNAFNLYEGSTRKFFLQLRIFGGHGDLHTRFVGTGAEYNSVNVGWSDANIGSWYHVAVVRDSGTFSMFLNGVCIGVHTNHTENIGSVDTLRIGYMTGDGTKYLDGYFQDFRFYTTAKYKGGFDVPRPYTPVGIATWRAVPDTTANNFATWNPLYPTIAGTSATYSDGNLKCSTSSTNSSQGSATLGVSSGKWYYEVRVDATPFSGSNLIGIRPADWITDNPQNRTSYRSNGDVYNDVGTIIQSGNTYTAGDTIGIAFDMNNRKIWFSKNGSWVYSGDPNNNSNPATTFSSTYSQYTPSFAYDNGSTSARTFIANFGQNPTFSGNITAGTYTDSNGKGLFKYEPPSGFLALCEDNLPAPTIRNPGEHFKTVLYNNATTVTGIGFTPDLIWHKSRTQTYPHYLYDSVRGVGAKGLNSNTTSAEGANDALGILSFDEDGFSFSSDAGLSQTNAVAWCWKAGGEAVTNTDGSITSQVSVNQDAGFSIVSFTMPSGTYTVGHGLGKTPKFIITKQRDGNYGWWTQHASIGSGTAYLELSSPNGSIQLSWGGVPNSSTFTINNSYAVAGQRVIAYCWTEIDGFSKFGSYVGNGSADGPFVYCGFKPAFILIKSSSASYNWYIIDNTRSSTNPVNLTLAPNTSNVEDSGWNGVCDLLSNGFKFRESNAAVNGSGETYIFAAFAESAFSYSNAK